MGGVKIPIDIKFPAVQYVQVVCTSNQGQNPKRAGKIVPQVVHTRLPIKRPKITKTACPFTVLSSGSALKYLNARNGIKANQKACKLHKLFIIKSSIPIISMPKKKLRYTQRQPRIPNHKASGITKIYAGHSINCPAKKGIITVKRAKKRARSIVNIKQ